MPDVAVTADLHVEDGVSTRPLSVDDLKTAATGAATETTLAAVLLELAAKLEEGGTVALDTATLAALESVTVSGTVSLDAASLAALESVTVANPVNTVSVDNFPATQPVSGTVSLSTASLNALETTELGATTLSALENTTVTVANPPTSPDASTEDFRRILKFEPTAGQELRADESTTDRYHGMAPDGTAEATASWKVVRFYKDASGNINRVRYRTGVAWSNRTAGWT